MLALLLAVLAAPAAGAPAAAPPVDAPAVVAPAAAPPVDAPAVAPAAAPPLASSAAVAPGSTFPAALSVPPFAPGAATGAKLAVATAAFERIVLPPGAGPKLRVDAMAASVVVPSRDPTALAKALAPRLGRLCPSLEVLADGVRLRCRTRRLAAELVSARSGSALELRELRGVPWRDGDDGPPRLPWDPVTLGAAPCPGVTPVVQGECALGRGDRATATSRFLAAADGPDRAWAVLRLGDLALAEDRLEDALGWWEAAGTVGRFARLAAARSCELTGKCLGTARFGNRFDTAGLPWPLGPELSLRAARVEVFLDRPGAAVRRILSLASPDRAAVCGWTATLCRRIALEALRGAEGSEREEALALYLSLPDHDRGPLSVELARAGAEAAASLGARTFGGNLLAAVAAHVPPAELPAHLLQAAELYVAAGDPVRAGVILEFARTKLPASRLAEPRWAAIVTAVTAGANPPAPTPASPPDPDLARARELLERARGATKPTP